jgi:hypothetical protein
MLGLVIIVNSFLSFRLDPVDFYKNHSKWCYEEESHAFSTALWIHKICSCLWTVLVPFHLHSISKMAATDPKLQSSQSQEEDGDPRSKYASRLFWHMFYGCLIIITSVAHCTSGAVMLYERSARFFSVTKYAFGTLLVAYGVCLVWILLDRIGGCKFKIGALQLGHQAPGLLFVSLPFSFLTQFFGYALSISGQDEEGVCDNGTHGFEYKAWSAWISTCGVVGLIISYSYIRITGYSLDGTNTSLKSSEVLEKLRHHPQLNRTANGDTKHEIQHDNHHIPLITENE